MQPSKQTQQGTYTNPYPNPYPNLRLSTPDCSARAIAWTAWATIRTHSWQQKTESPAPVAAAG